MSINSISASNPLLSQLQVNGLSSAKANLVAGDIAASVPQGTTGAPPAMTPAVRSAIDAKIAADVSSGKLSQKDADAVTKTLDDATGSTDASGAASVAGTTATAASGAPAKTAHAGGGHGGGGGGSSDDSKTILSETVTVDGSTETTIITYTDGTTDTETSTASVADQNSDAGAGATAGTGTSAANGYGAAPLDPGLLVNKNA